MCPSLIMVHKIINVNCFVVSTFVTKISNIVTNEHTKTIFHVHLVCHPQTIY